MREGGTAKTHKDLWIVGPSRIQELLEFIYFNYLHSEDGELLYLVNKVAKEWQSCNSNLGCPTPATVRTPPFTVQLLIRKKRRVKRAFRADDGHQGLQTLDLEKS